MSTVTLRVVRHGPYDHSVRPAADAPLTTAGLEQARRRATEYAKLPTWPTNRPLVLHSSALRAIQSAQPTAALLGADSYVADWLTYGPRDLTDLLAHKVWQLTDMVICFGHQPAIDYLLYLATGRQGDFDVQPGDVFTFRIDTTSRAIDLVTAPAMSSL